MKTIYLLVFSYKKEVLNEITNLDDRGIDVTSIPFTKELIK